MTKDTGIKYWVYSIAIAVICCIICITVYHTGNSKATNRIFGTSSAESNGKKIFYFGRSGGPFNKQLRFDRCNYSNCVFYFQKDLRYIAEADSVIVEFNFNKMASLKVSADVRERQLWLVYSHESPAFTFNRWSKRLNDFNGTLTYLHDSVPASIPWGLSVNKSTIPNASSVINYAKGKTKGAFAYVSQCDSQQYNRLKTMEKLGKYINVDIYGGCTRRRPCPRKRDSSCEIKKHSQYRFFLAFENSLCTEYITEKFWRNLQSNGYFIPVAIGGLSVDEYTRVAPPDSFIHAYNFSSITLLGKYLKTLMNDDAAFNRYHQWRQKYKIEMNALNYNFCNVCEVVNHPEMLSSVKHRKLAAEWNNLARCKKRLFS